VITSRVLEDFLNEEDGKVFKFRKWGNIFCKISFTSFGNTNKYVSYPIKGFSAITCKKCLRLLPSKGLPIELETSIFMLNSNYAEVATIEVHRIGGVSSTKSVGTTMVSNFN
jgi:hypothetical protein